MKQRVITAIIAVGIFLPILYVGDIWLRTLLALLAIVGIYEFFQMKKMNIFSDRRISHVTGYIVISVFTKTISRFTKRN